MISAFFPTNSVEVKAGCWLENQQIMYDWDVERVLPRLKAGGIWIAPAPRSPLSSEQLVEVLFRLSQNPLYDMQTIKIRDYDGALVALIEGGELIQLGG